MTSRVHEADRFLALGDSTSAWWMYVTATVWPEDRGLCRDQSEGPGVFGRALAFTAEHADIYRRDSIRTLRRGFHGPYVGDEFYISGVRLDSHMVTLYREIFPRESSSLAR